MKNLGLVQMFNSLGRSKSKNLKGFQVWYDLRGSVVIQVSAIFYGAEELIGAAVFAEDNVIHSRHI